MFNKKAFLVLFLLLVAIGTVSSVSAVDLTDDVIAEDAISDDTLSEDLVIEDIESNDNDEVELSENNDLDNVINEEEKTNDDASDTIVSNKEVSDKVLGEEDWSEWSTFSDLQSGLSDVSQYATITLYQDFYCDDNFHDYGLRITKTLTINGNGHIFDGRGKSEIFLIFADNVVLNNITFRNAKDSENGGAIYIYNNRTSMKTTFNNCTFINNSAGGAGGAIYTTSQLEINGCTFSKNSADSGGAIFAYHALGSIDAVNITNSKFTDNTATKYGGAVFLNSHTINGGFSNKVGRSYITNTTFSTNKADEGGAIHNLQYIDIVDSKFMANTANDGGAIYSDNGHYIDDEFVQYFGLEIHGKTSFINNTATKHGGAVKIYAIPEELSNGVKGILKVYDNVLFEGNSANSGGALSVVDSNCSVNNAVFRNNKAVANGSAMEGGSANNCIFEGNSEPATSGAKIANKGILSLKQSGTYYKGKTLTVTLVFSDSKAGIPNQKVVVKFSNGKSVTLTTNSKGIATYSIPFAPGTYTATASATGANMAVSDVKLTGIKIAKIPIAIAPTKLSTTYDSGKYFQIKVKNSKTGKVVSGVKLKLKVYTGKKYKTVTVTTNSKGIAKYAASKLAIGTHKIIVTNGQTAYYTGSKKTSSVKVAKASYKVTAPAVTKAYKKAGAFKITVKNKASKKALKGVKVKVKVYTGTKFKSYTLKTNKKGIATIKTKSLAKGKHKVAIAIAKSKYYKAKSASSSIKIK